MWKCVEEMENEWIQKGKQKERQTAIITMIELGLTKEQILTKYSEKDYLKTEKALNNKQKTSGVTDSPNEATPQDFL